MLNRTLLAALIGSLSGAWATGLLGQEGETGATVDSSAVSAPPSEPLGDKTEGGKTGDGEPGGGTTGDGEPGDDEEVSGKPSAEAEANNPLANMKAFNLQNYYVDEVSGTDENANMFWFRYAQPIATPLGKWLVRASLPINRVPTGVNESESGIGDSNVFATYLVDSGEPAVSVGVGPLLGIPTAEDDDLGTDQWSLGAAAVYFNARSPVVQFGGLVTYQHKVGGSGRLDDVNFLAIQPFGFLQLGDGYYLRSAPIWAFNLESGDHGVPFGVGVGKVVKIDKLVVNAFIEPQFSILDDGPGQPEAQVFIGLNLQFLGS